MMRIEMCYETFYHISVRAYDGHNNYDLITMSQKRKKGTRSEEKFHVKV